VRFRWFENLMIRKIRSRIFLKVQKEKNKRRLKKVLPTSHLFKAGLVLLCLPSLQL